MIREYSLFYYYHKIHDELVVRFCDEEITYESQIDHVKVSYHNVDLVSYEISDINKIMKIHLDGLIPLPNKEMIDVINSILKKAGLETLAYKTHSDFYIGEVIETSPKIKVRTSLGEYEFDDKIVLLEQNQVVIALKGSFLPNGKYLKNHHLCTYQDLDISSKNQIAIIDKTDNDDFFKMEEK